ncbi:MAG: FAD-dependent oxidoreductase [Beijerinckiaceae bacterium]|nr:FAD-dependent oxidoreductase [Beijerinckiaceae bacterium]
MNFAPRPLRIAVIGAGVTGLAAAWLLSTHHRVTLYEAGPKLGGHSNTVMVDCAEGRIPVDTGFIVYNELTYPNLIAMFEHLGVATKASDMSFAVSMDRGATEYCGSGLGGLFAQKGNLLNPRFWRMCADLVRFYRAAKADMRNLSGLTLEQYLDEGRYSQAFRDLHLYPMAAAIWSTPAGKIGDYPAEAFIRFCRNHRLLELGERPRWRTVEGGSIEYVRKLESLITGDIRLATPVRQVVRGPIGVEVHDAAGGMDTFDHVVLATHADQTVAMLADADQMEREVLGAFRYSKNRAVLHTDEKLMPTRRSVWSSWNYLAEGQGADRRPPAVTYWMNRLQGLPTAQNIFVSLNSPQEPRADLTLRDITYDHPVFDAGAIAAQRHVWSLQGRRNTWFCGAWMGAGFHEDGLQSGLAVAEALGSVRRPWRVAEESGRVFVSPPPDLAGAELTP